MATTKSKPDKLKIDWTERLVLDALESQFIDRSKGTFLRGARDATSWDGRRTADGLYMGAWKSVGVQLHGFEVKVSRSDWLREIQDPSKAGQFEQYCHYWWVAVPEGIVNLEEMPAHWGLKIVSKTSDGYSVRVKKPATINRSAKLDYAFFSSCLRQCRKTDPVEAELNKVAEEAFERGKQEAAKKDPDNIRLEWAESKLKDAQERIEQFEQASGVTIDTWSHSPKQIGQAVRTVLQLEQIQKNRLPHMASACNELKKLVDELLAVPLAQ